MIKNPERLVSCHKDFEYIQVSIPLASVAAMGGAIISRDNEVARYTLVDLIMMGIRIKKEVGPSINNHHP